MTRRPLLLAAAGLLTVSALSGCSLTFAGGTPASHATGGASPSAKSSHPAADTSHQRPLTAVPTVCPSPDAISISVKVSLPSVDPNPLGDNKLECTYYNPATPSKGLSMTFGPSEGASAAQFSQQVLAANPSAIAVPGVGDAAYFFTQNVSGTTIGSMNYLSGAVFGYVAGDVTFASQEHLTALIADQILVP